MSASTWSYDLIRRGKNDVLDERGPRIWNQSNCTWVNGARFSKRRNAPKPTGHWAPEICTWSTAVCAVNLRGRAGQVWSENPAGHEQQ